MLHIVLSGGDTVMNKIDRAYPQGDYGVMEKTCI